MVHTLGLEVYRGERAKRPKVTGPAPSSFITRTYLNMTEQLKHSAVKKGLGEDERAG